jgi:hypothetical protein
VKTQSERDLAQKAISEAEKWGEEHVERCEKLKKKKIGGEN